MSNALTQGRVLFVACVAALGGILFGYDTAVISGTTRIVADQNTGDRKSTRLNSSHIQKSRMPSSA